MQGVCACRVDFRECSSLECLTSWRRGYILQASFLNFQRHRFNARVKPRAIRAQSCLIEPTHWPCNLFFDKWCTPCCAMQMLLVYAAESESLFMIRDFSVLLSRQHCHTQTHGDRSKLQSGAASSQTSLPFSQEAHKPCMVVCLLGASAAFQSYKAAESTTSKVLAI